jgi:quercetin dioxygenase-like cupin family protein
MTTKPKPEAKADEQTVQPEPKADERTVVGPRCGAPHFLPVLAGRVTCQLGAQELEPGEAGHEHRHQDGDELYVWR